MLQIVKMIMGFSGLEGGLQSEGAYELLPSWEDATMAFDTSEMYDFDPAMPGFQLGPGDRHHEMLFDLNAVFQAF